jgi:hypothetical protein
MAEKLLFKRTTPLFKQCQYVFDDGEMLVRCDDTADFGLYFGTAQVIAQISLCFYHTVNQESLWAGGKEI